MVDYEVKVYIVRWRDMDTDRLHEEKYNLEELALEHYKELLEDENAYCLAFEKVLALVDFSWDGE